MATRPDRRRLLAAVHAEAKALGLDEDTRRALQQRVGGHASCADMSDRELRSVLAELHRLAGKPARPRRPADDRARLLWRIERDCAAAGYPHPAYPLGISRRMFGALSPARLEWHAPAQLRAIIAALAYDAKRQPRGHRGDAA